MNIENEKNEIENGIEQDEETNDLDRQETIEENLIKEFENIENKNNLKWNIRREFLMKERKLDENKQDRDKRILGVKVRKQEIIRRLITK